MSVKSQLLTELAQGAWMAQQVIQPDRGHVLVMVGLRCGCVNKLLTKKVTYEKVINSRFVLFIELC